VARLGFRICNDGPFFAALVHHLGDLQALDYAERLTDEGYMGSFASLGDWARELAESGATSFNRPIGAYQQWADVTASAQRRGEILVIEDEGRFHVFRR
jgi:hypothetical protein